MADVLVTGGTGTLGRAVVASLLARGHGTRVLSRGGGGPPGATVVRGDLATGAGLDEAVAEAAAIVHCASATGTLRRSAHRAIDVEGTRRLAEAARGAGIAHLLLISIVGIDDVPYSYYRAKLAAEREAERSGVPWTILRTTQFHDLVLLALRGLDRGPVFFVPREVPLQPVDAGEVANRLVELVETGPSGRVPDLGGPEVLLSDELAARYLAARGRPRRTARFSVPGQVGRALRAGRLLSPDGDRGEVTFERFLARSL